MKLGLSYSRASLHEAAQFIWDHNKSVLDWPSKPVSAFDVACQMKEMMVKGAKRNATMIRDEVFKNPSKDEWVTFDGTGGYYFIYELIDTFGDEIVIAVDILVDVAVSHPARGYTRELIDIDD